MEYKYVGIIFNKEVTENYTLVIPVSVLECNDSANLLYDVKELGEISTVYENTGGDEVETVGFVISKEKLKELYPEHNLEDAMRAYYDSFLDSIFYQVEDAINDTTNTYRYIISDKKVFEVSKYSMDGLALYDYLSNNKEEKKEEFKFNMIETYKHVRSQVISQDAAVKKIVSILDRNFSIDNFRNKTNMLVIGPSGVGKTEIFRSIDSVINVPIVVTDASQYSAAGYEGADVTDMLVDLYYRANCDINNAQKGILVIDEIDKKVTSSRDDASGTRVINSLLSLMEGSKININIGSHMNQNLIEFDTSRLTICLVGAFSSIVSSANGVGFNKSLLKEGKGYNQVKNEDLIKYGLPVDLLRRVSIITLNNLECSDMIKIMKESSNSCLNSYMEYANGKGVNLSISDDAITSIAKDAYDRGIGVSGIKDALNKILDEAFFDVCECGNIESIVVDSDSLNKVPPYKLVKKLNSCVNLCKSEQN